MTPTEIIEIVDRITPNAHTTADKLRWLKQLDTQVETELAFLLWTAPERKNHALCRSAAEAAETLTVPEPFAEELYVSYLQACMAWADEEDARYDRFITRFNDAYCRFMRLVVQECVQLRKQHLIF